MDRTIPSLSAPPPRLWTLDALRGACASIVFLNHWHLWSGFDPSTSFERKLHATGGLLYDLLYNVTWPPGGHHPAVICFFVLSGFCIHFPFENRRRSGTAAIDWKDYFHRRFWRIMPVYWTASLLGLVLVALEKTHPSGSLLLVLHSSAPAPEVAVRFLGLAGLYPREIFAGNYILNTVAVEMLMYAVYPIFFHYAAQGRWRTLWISFLAMYASTILLVEVATPYWVFNSVFMLGIFWFFGAYAAHLFVARQKRISALWPACAWIGFTLLKKFPHFYGLNLIVQLAWGGVCMLGILWMTGREKPESAPRDSFVRSALSFASRISYSLYAVHTPVVMITFWFLLVVVGSKNYSLQLAASMVTSIAMTLAVYYGVERVFYRPRN